MAGYFEQWKEEQRILSEEFARKYRKKIMIHCVMLILTVIAQCGVLSFSEKYFEELENNQFIMINTSMWFITWCMIMGLIVVVIHRAGKMYIQSVQKIALTLTEMEKEEFAVQMLGIENPDSVKVFEWTGRSNIKKTVHVTRDYATFITERGDISMVRLQRLESMAFEDKEGGRVFVLDDLQYFWRCKTYKPLYFYLRKENPNVIVGCKECFFFEREEEREQVARCIREIKERYRNGNGN